MQDRHDQSSETRLEADPDESYLPPSWYRDASLWCVQVFLAALGFFVGYVGWAGSHL